MTEDMKARMPPGPADIDFYNVPNTWSVGSSGCNTDHAGRMTDP